MKPRQEKKLLSIGTTLDIEKRNVPYLFSDLCLQRSSVFARVALVRSVGNFRFVTRSLLLLFIFAILCTELFGNRGVNLLEQRLRLKINIYMIHRVHSQATCANEEKLAIGCKAINYLVHEIVALGSLIWVQFLAANMVVKNKDGDERTIIFFFGINIGPFSLP